MLDIDAKGAERVTTALRDEGGDAYFSVVDLTDWAAMQAALEESHRRSGRLDIVVHSAGGFPRYLNLMECPVEAWGGVVDANLKSI